MKAFNKLLNTVVILSLISSPLIAQTESINYLDQVPVGNTQQIFPLEVSSGYSAIERIAFSNDGKEIYYSEMDIDASYNYFNNARIKYYQHDDTQWKGPFVLFENFFAPFITPYGDTMFLKSSNESLLSYSIKTDTGWSTPMVFMENLELLGESKFEGNLQITNKGNYYLTSSNTDNGIGGVDVAKILFAENDTIVESLGLPINNKANNNYLLMANDESYAITYTLQGGDHQEGRALISYPKDDGTWTNPKSMGFGGWGVTLSPDSKYLFHSSYDGARFDTYWIRIDSLIEALKHTNFKPYLTTQIADTTINEGDEFNMALAENMFIDDDGNQTLTITAKQNNGDDLPDELEFNEESLEFIGTLNAAGKYNIKITATDADGETVSDIFVITVEEAISIHNSISSENILIFPNPSSGKIMLSFEQQIVDGAIQVFNMQGKLVMEDTLNNMKSKTIDLTNYPKGNYIVKYFSDKVSVSEKICIN